MLSRLLTQNSLVPIVCDLGPAATVKSLKTKAGL